MASGMNGQSFVRWQLASPQLFGALAKKSPPGDNGDLEAHGQDMEGKRVDRNGGSLAVPVRSLMALTITARWLQVFSGGLGSPLAGQTQA